MLLEASLFVFVYLYEAMKHSSSNGYASWQHNTPFPMLRGEGAKNLIFCMAFGSCLDDMVCAIMTLYMLLEDLSISLIHIAKVIKKPKHQWLSLFSSQRTTSCAESVPKIWYFGWHMRVVIDKNDIVWAIRGSYMLSEALPIIFLYISEVMKHSSGNGCHFL